MFQINDKHNFESWIKNLKKQFPDGENTTSNEETIFIDAYWQDYLSVFLPRILYAKGLQEKMRNVNVVLLTTQHNEELKVLCDAFGVQVKTIPNKSMRLKSIWQSLIWYVFYNTEEKIYDLKIDNVTIGPYLCDHIVRVTDDLFAFKRIRLRDLKKCTSFLLLFYSARKLFHENRVRYYLAHEVGYWYGGILKSAERQGAEIVQLLRNGAAVHLGDAYQLAISPSSSSAYMIREKLKKIDADHFDYQGWCQDYFMSRRLGNSDREARFAYANKNVASREEWMSASGADSSKKNIVIMAHCFSDNSYTSTPERLYRNYYDWLIATLEIIKDIHNVNWLLKAHPARHLYREGDHIYRIFERYANRKNVFILDDNISTESLYDIIDAAVTVKGTCGLEFSAFGIPVVCAGRAPYCGLGFTIEPKTISAYAEQLSHMDVLKRLDEEKINIARKASYAYFSLLFPEDPILKLLWESYNNYKDPVQCNDYVIAKMCELGCQIKETWLYQM